MIDYFTMISKESFKKGFIKYYDMNELTKNMLGAEYKALSKEDKKKSIALVKEFFLVVNSNPSLQEILREGKCSVTKVTVEKNKAKVETNASFKEHSSHSIFSLIKINNEWKIYSATLKGKLPLSELFKNNYSKVKGELGIIKYLEITNMRIRKQVKAAKKK